MKTPKLPRGVTVHNGSLRIAFSHPDYPNQIKRSLRIPPTAKNIRAAEMKLSVIKHELLLGTFDFDTHFKNDPLSKNKPIYLVDMVKHHVIDDATKNNLKAGTIRWYTSMYNTLLAHAGSIDLSKQTPTLANELFETLSENATPSRAKDIIKLCKRACTKAMQLGALDKNPFEFFKAPKAKSKQLSPEDVFTQAESEQIVQSSRQLYGDLAALYLTFQFWSGCRPGETRALTRHDFKDGKLTISKTAIQAPAFENGITYNSPKTSAGIRTIVLPVRAANAFTAAIATHDKNEAFPNVHNDVNKSINVVNYPAWVAILKHAGLRYRPLYRTRHSFISWMVSAGEPLIKVAHHVGHRGTSMIEKVYGRFLPDKDMKWSFDDP